MNMTRALCVVIVAAALSALHADGKLDAKFVAQAIQVLGVNPDKVYSARV